MWVSRSGDAKLMLNCYTLFTSLHFTLLYFTSLYCDVLRAVRLSWRRSTRVVRLVVEMRERRRVWQQSTTSLTTTTRCNCALPTLPIYTTITQSCRSRSRSATSLCMNIVSYIDWSDVAVIYKRCYWMKTHQDLTGRGCWVLANNTPCPLVFLYGII